MKLKIQKLIALAVLVFSFTLVPSTALAVACSDSNLTAKEAIQCGSGSAAGNENQTPAQGAKSLSDTIAGIINFLSVAVGITAVIMIIVGGFRYITSSGVAEKIASAKTTLLYALIGLIIVALAQVIVKFVLTQVTSTSTNGQCVQIGPKKVNSVTGQPC